jgi:hypothetical protein
MKTVVAEIVVLFLVLSASLRAADAPRGELLELHSCQLYIGGCIASSETTQEGQYQLRVWTFAAGSVDGTDLGGLTVALLETADQNLALGGTLPTEAMLYLPQSATPAQAAALIEWIKADNPELSGMKWRLRTVPMTFAHGQNAVSFSAGNFLQVQTRPFAPCGLISCGESLWYTPRSTLTSYTVGVTSTATVCEPALWLRWIDHNKNNIFLGRFGDGAPARAAFTPPSMLCAVADHISHE